MNSASFDSQVDLREAEVHRQALQVEQPVLAAGHRVPLDRDEPEHLAERDGQQCVVDAAAVRDERRHERAGERGGEHCRRRDRATGSRHVLELHQAERVRADAEERAVAERRQPGVAEQAGCSPSHRSSRSRSRAPRYWYRPMRGSHSGAVARISDQRDERHRNAAATGRARRRRERRSAMRVGSRWSSKRRLGSGRCGRLASATMRCSNPGHDRINIPS